MIDLYSGGIVMDFFRVVRKSVGGYGLMVILLLCLIPESFAEEVKKIGTLQSAKPVALQNNVPLKKIVTLPQLKTGVVSSGQSVVPNAYQNKIESCDLVAVQGRQMQLAIKYRLDPGIKGPVYTGAFLYDAANKAVNAGYLPGELKVLPNGKTVITLVLPETAFHSDTVDAFLIRDGKIIVSQRFRLVYAWNGNSGSLAGKTQTPGPAQTKASFCRAYAEQAVSQYRLGLLHKVQGITGPAWSDDILGHYQWCMGVPNELALQENNRRNDHLQRTLPTGTPGLAELQKNALDPGLGP